MSFTQLSSAVVAILVLGFSQIRAAEAPKAVAESAEQRAARLLKEESKLESVRSQERRQEADNAYQTGLRLMNDLEYEQAKGWFERALEIAPGFEPAREKLHTINSLLGIHTERIAEKIRDLDNEAKTQAQEAVIVIQNLIEEARRLEEKATQLPADSDRSSSADRLASQLKYLQQAQEKLMRAKELIDYLPSYVKYSGSGVDRELKRLKGQLNRE